MTEVPDQTQAEMAIKLSDNVRELVRQHLKEALEDPAFMGMLQSYCMAQSVMRHAGSLPDFIAGVKHTIASQMSR